jgi:hypothetical protein
MEQTVHLSQTLLNGLLIFLNFLLLTVSGGACWFLRELWAAHKELRQEISALKEALPSTYAAKGEIDKGFIRMFDKLDEMREHFDKRMDAHELRYHKANPI